MGNSRFSNQLVRALRVVECALIRTRFPIVTSTDMACAKVSSDGSYNEILTRASTLILKDEGFSLPSVPAWKARKNGSKAVRVEWDSENKSAWRVV